MANQTEHPSFVVPNPDHEKKVREIREEVDPLFQPLLSELERLEDEIQKMTLAERFSTTEKINRREANTSGKDVTRGRGNLTEAEFKKAQLTDRIRKIRNYLASAGFDLENLKMEIYVSGQEF